MMDYLSEGVDVDKLTPEEIEMYMAAGIIPTEQKLLEKQMEYANQLRTARGPQGRTAGGMYHAANPLEHLGSALSKYQGQKDYGAAEQGMKDTAQRQADIRGKYFSDLLRRGGRGGAAQGTPGIAYDPKGRYGI